MSTSTELTVFERVTDPLAFSNDFGQSIFDSALLGCRNVAQGRVMALTCLTEKKTPIELARVYHIIDNKLSMRADAMLAEFRKAGGKYKWISTGDDGVAARALFTFEGESIEIGYTIEDAKRAKLIRSGGNWEKDPGSMLRARTASKAVRMLAPEIVAGYYTPEELGDVIDSTFTDVNQGGANGTAKRATVDELLAKSAAATPTTVADKDVIDVEAEPVATTPATCTADQSNRIHDLFISLQIAHATQEKVLTKYGAQAARNLTGEQAAALIAKLEAMPAKLPPAVNSASDYDIVGGQLLDDLKAEVAKLQALGDIATMKRIADKLGGRKIGQLCHRDAEALLQAMKLANLDGFFARDLLGKDDQPKEFPTKEESAAHAATVEAAPFDAK